MMNRNPATQVVFALITALITALCATTGAAQQADQLGGSIEGLPQHSPERFQLPALAAPSIDTARIGNGRIPDGFRGDQAAPTYRLAESAGERDPAWDWTVGRWAAADTFSKPRYFEDRMLERHGHQRFGRLQPVAAGARFFATVPMLPYLMTLRHPHDCEYTLGYYRSGSRVPGLVQRPPHDRRAAVVEAAAVAGAIIAFP